MVGGGEGDATARRAAVRVFAGLLLAAAVVAVLVGNPYITVVAAVIACVAAWFLDSRAVYGALRVGVVLAVVFAAAITTAVVAWAEGPERGIAVGGMVLLRLLVLTVAAAALVRRVDAEAFFRLTQRFGLERLGLVRPRATDGQRRRRHQPAGAPGRKRPVASRMAARRQPRPRAGLRH